MTDVSISPVGRHDAYTCAGGGDAAPGLAAWLGFAAAPTFALMALWTALFHQPAGHALHGDTRLIAHERNDDDVCADERLPFIALAETDL